MTRDPTSPSTLIVTLSNQTTNDVSSEPRIEPAEVMRGLLRQGYTKILLKNLRLLGARWGNGEAAEWIETHVREDAEFLAIGYRSLEKILHSGKPALHRVYIADGTFEISAMVGWEEASVRAGEHQTEFHIDQAETVRMPTQEYMAVWHNLVRDMERTTSQGTDPTTPPHSSSSPS